MLLLACKIMEVSNHKFNNIQQCVEYCRMRPQLQIVAVRLDIMMAKGSSGKGNLKGKKVCWQAIVLDLLQLTHLCILLVAARAGSI